MRSHLLPLSSSSKSIFFLKSLTSSSSRSYPSLNQFGRGYGSSQGQEARAPSTAEEFKRVAEEKLKKAEKGVGSQTIEKTSDATKEATFGDRKPESVKGKYKQHEHGEQTERPQDDD